MEAGMMDYREQDRQIREEEKECKKIVYVDNGSSYSVKEV